MSAVNPATAPPLSEYNIYRDSGGSYRCPVYGCSQSFGAPESLKYHMNKSHPSQENPNTHSSTYSKAVPSGISHGNQAGSPTVRESSQPMHSTQPLPQRTLQNVPQITRRIIHDPPNNRQMLPPTYAPTLGTDAVNPIQNHPPSWVETTRWPEKTEIFLKELAHTHALYANPTSKEDHGKLCSIFDEFYDKTDFRNWKPEKGDERLWQLFRAKLDQIQTGMLLRGETIKTKDGSIQRVILPQAKLVAVDNNTPESLATPPATPFLGNDKCCDGLELWNGLDVDAQTALFRQQLRNAKNRKGLMLEWNEYCTEVKEKRDRAKPRDPNRKSTTPSESSSGSKTPPSPPATTLPVAVDVKEIIARKIKELQMKRDRDLLQASEERASKRLKGDPA
ncbi:hypothetical protein IFR05_001921 [Cadophora sp. M221]|nr:hypothetical protein IFR05_001921 [Cadophora sp. M221]